MKGFMFLSFLECVGLNSETYQRRYSSVLVFLITVEHNTAVPILVIFASLLQSSFCSKQHDTVIKP